MFFFLNLILKVSDYTITKQTKNRKQLTKMSSSSKIPPVAQTPTKTPSPPVKKTPSQPVKKEATLIGRIRTGSATCTPNCYHDWILCSHPTIPYTALFCQKCGVEKRQSIIKYSETRIINKFFMSFFLNLIFQLS